MGKNKLWQNFMTLAIIGFVLLVVWASIAGRAFKPVSQVSLSQIATEVKDGKIDKIKLKGNQITATTKDGKTEQAYKESAEGLKDYGITSDLVKIDISNPDSGAMWSTILTLAVPILLVVAMLWFFTRQARGGGAGAMSFGQTTARLFEGKKLTTFNDVAGLKHAKQDLIEIVDFLKNPKKYLALGAEIPRGVLLIGPAGVGKTLLARAVAGEAEVPFFSLSASEFVEMFVGVGAARVRDLFTKAKRNSPAVIFIDELDAIGRQRGSGMGGSHDEREQTLNQILVEMDGFDTEQSVIVLAATNRPDVLDPALLRPGRFDRKVVLDLPDRGERKEIAEVYIRNKPMDKNVNLDEFSKSTPGLSGADIKNIINESAIIAARENRKTIEQKDVRRSIEREMLGAERTSNLLESKEREIVAYHEAGHAIIGHVLPELDRVSKVSLVSRGMALGYTLSLPEQDRHLISKTKMINEIVMLLGGRAAEFLKFNEITTGASNDLDRATKIARDMVTVYGMSEIGPIKFGEREETIFLGREMSTHKINSEKLASQIDSEIIRIIDEAWKKSLEILKKKSKALEAIAKGLLEKETLEDDDLATILATLK